MIGRAHVVSRHVNLFDCPGFRLRRLVAASGARTSCRSGTGFTLLEMLLVLALIVILAATASLNMRRGFNQQRLRKAADQIRTTFARTRVKAIKTGRVQVFYFAIDKDHYLQGTQASRGDANLSFSSASSTRGMTGRTSAGVTGLGASAATTARPIQGSSQRVNSAGDRTQMLAQQVVQRTLPEGIRFLGADVRVDQKSNVLLSQAVAPSEWLLDVADGEPALSNTEALTRPTQWGMPIYFYPDGTTSSARLTLQDESLNFISVYLRGLTGIAQVGPISDEPAFSGQTPMTRAGVR